MSDSKALFLINQLNPIIRQTKSYIRKLAVDPDNEDIKLINMFNATLHRIPYGGRSGIQVAYDIFDYLRG